MGLASVSIAGMSQLRVPVGPHTRRPAAPTPLETRRPLGGRARPAAVRSPLCGWRSGRSSRRSRSGARSSPGPARPQPRVYHHPGRLGAALEVRFAALAVLCWLRRQPLGETWRERNPPRIGFRWPALTHPERSWTAYGTAENPPGEWDLALLGGGGGIRTHGGPNGPQRFSRPPRRG